MGMNVVERKSRLKKQDRVVGFPNFEKMAFFLSFSLLFLLY